MSKEKRRITRKLRSEVVEIEDEKGEAKDYIIQEFDGIERDKYLNFQRTRTKITSDGKGEQVVEITDFTGQFARLLEVTLWETNDGITPTKLVDPKFVRTLPSSQQQELFIIAGEVCAAIPGGDAEDEAKNSSQGQEKQMPG